MTVSIVPRPAGWLPATRAADGLPFWIVPGSKPGTVYYTTATACTCPSARHRGGACKHQKQVAEVERGYSHAKHQPAPKRASYEELFPTCGAAGCDNDPEPPEPYCHRHVLVDAF